MRKNASLDSFLPSEESAEGEKAEGETATHPDEDEEEDFNRADAQEGATPETDQSESTRGTDQVEPSPVEAAIGVFRWHPDGAPCEECDSVVRRRWRVGEKWCCGSCVPWKRP